MKIEDVHAAACEAARRHYDSVQAANRAVSNAERESRNELHRATLRYLREARDKGKDAHELEQKFVRLWDRSERDRGSRPSVSTELDQHLRETASPDSAGARLITAEDQARAAMHKATDAHNAVNAARKLVGIVENDRVNKVVTHQDMYDLINALDDMDDDDEEIVRCYLLTIGVDVLRKKRHEART